MALIKDQLLEPDENIPEQLFDPAQLTELGQLLIYASSNEKKDRELQKWACAILRVMHVYVHLRHDLFSGFSDEIQNQILKSIQDTIVTDPVVGSTVMGGSSYTDSIRLHKFDIKPFKTTASSVIKLLARPEKVALTLLDKLGVRFITRSVFDSFRVVQFLVENHILSFSHIIPDQSNNTLYPLNFFIEVMEELKNKKPLPNEEEVEEFLSRRLRERAHQGEYLEKYNEFSGQDYRFIKFISRKLITVSLGANEAQRQFRFFYPYEVQIMDYNTYLKNLSGPMAHDEYKNRQRKAARDRVLGVSKVEGT